MERKPLPQGPMTEKARAIGDHKSMLQGDVALPVAAWVLQEPNGKGTKQRDSGKHYLSLPPRPFQRAWRKNGLTFDSARGINSPMGEPTASRGDSYAEQDSQQLGSDIGGMDGGQ